MSDITFNDNGGNPKSRNEDGANREKYKYTPHIYFKEITNKEIVLLGVEPISRYGI
jgi:hypothetical protein